MLAKSLRPPTVIMLISLFVLGYNIFRSWAFTIDDAYISFRYSANLAAGLGPTFNNATSHIEGYTSFLWVILIAVPHAFGLDAVLTAKLLGILSSGVTLVLCFALVIELCSSIEKRKRYIPAAAAVMMLCVFPSTWVHAVSGLETATCTCLLTLFAFLVVKGIHRIADWVRVIPFVGLLLGLTRPEANLIILPTLITFLVLIGAERKTEKIAFSASIMLLYVIPGAAYFGWRATYYGLFFPLPFYVKTITGSFLPGMFITSSFVFYVLICDLGVLIAMALLSFDKRHYLLLGIVGTLVFFWFFPEHQMDYSWRYLYPAVPILFSIAASGIGVLLSQIEPNLTQGKEPLRSIKSFAIQGLILTSMAISIYRGTNSEMRTRKEYADGMESAHIKLGKVLKAFSEEHYSSIQPRLVIADAGAVPYYSQWYTIDSFGLNDIAIATTRNHDPQYILSQNPSAIVLISADENIFKEQLSWEKGLYDACIRAGFAKVVALKFKEQYYLYVMGLSGGDLHRFLTERLSQVGATQNRR